MLPLGRTVRGRGGGEDAVRSNVSCYVLTSSMVCAAPRQQVFAFFADAGNLEEITPPWLHFEIVTPRPIVMAVGTLIDYRLRLHGVPFSWRTEIAAWGPPTRFVDRQLLGPYHEWVHEHLFEEEGGATRVVDRVRFRPRGGALTQALFVGRDVRRIFTYRQARLLEAFGGQAGDVVVARCRP